MTTPDLKALSDAATQGPWFLTGLPWFDDGGEGIVAGSPDGNICAPVADCNVFNCGIEYHEQGSAFSMGDLYDPRADAAYIVALVNAHRAGQLFTAADVEAAVMAEREAVASWYEVEGWLLDEDDVSTAIRARTTQEGET